MLEEHEESIRGADEGVVVENLVGVEGRSFVTIVEDQDTMCVISQIRHDYHAAIVLILTM